MKTTHVLLGGLLLASGTAVQAAQGFDPNRIYFGGGVSYNDASGFDEEIGWQVLGGYDLGVPLGTADLAVEAGYMRAGDYRGTKVDGLWATAVAGIELNPQLQALGRIGLDFGDDDGLMFGAGLGYTVSRQVELRGEFVIRDHIDSLQLNFIYRP